MKRLLVIAVCVLTGFCAIKCKKSTPKNNATCTTCSGKPVAHDSDSAGVYYFMPTAFTPNGDGINDVYRVVYKNLDTNSSMITIWDITGTEVFTGKITQRWEGFDLKGNKCLSGQYPVYAALKTLSGTAITMCTCVSLLVYTGSCIKTNGVTYYFPDQLNTLSGNGFSFATNETLCP
jgi:gliding motility-associated-like protein